MNDVQHDFPLFASLALFSTTLLSAWVLCLLLDHKPRNPAVKAVREEPRKRRKMAEPRRVLAAKSRYLRKVGWHREHPLFHQMGTFAAGGIEHRAAAVAIREWRQTTNQVRVHPEERTHYCKTCEREYVCVYADPQRNKTCPQCGGDGRYFKQWSTRHESAGIGRAPRRVLRREPSSSRLDEDARIGPPRSSFLGSSQGGFRRGHGRILA